MFKLIVLVGLVAAVSAQRFHNNNGRFFNNAPAAAPINFRKGSDAEVQRYNVDVRADGFQYNYELSNGISAAAAGDQYGNHQGTFGWTSPEGTPVKIDYVANEEGYQPRGDALPTPPPIPDAILRSLEYIRTHPNQESRQSTSSRFF